MAPPLLLLLLLLHASRCASGASPLSGAPKRLGSRSRSSTTAGVSFPPLFLFELEKRRRRTRRKKREERRRGTRRKKRKERKPTFSQKFSQKKILTNPCRPPPTPSGPGFATSKSFAWCDEYNQASAPNRKVRRLMEEDNKKKRSKAKKEFNETVRALAAFVRKRDKRAAAAAAAAAAKRAAAAEAEAQRRAAEKAERAARAAAYREQIEHEGDDDEQEEGGDGDRESGETESEEGEERQVLLECVACSKRFRSDAAFANHERSRKHLEAVAALRAALAEVRRSFFFQGRREDF